MSTMINNGGPAFPRPASEYTQQGTLPDGNDAIKAQEGMTLRDYLATGAMQGILSGTVMGPDTGDVTTLIYWGDKLRWNHTQAAEWIAEMSYELADAMLARRKS